MALPFPSPAQHQLTDHQRQLNIDSFEMVWQTIRDKHWDPKLGGLDWQAVHNELRPKVEKAATMDEARAVMEDMIGRLKETHFAIVPGDTYEEMGSSSSSENSKPRDGSSGMVPRVIDGHALVIDVIADSPAAAAGVKPGWEILSIDGKDVAPALAKIRGSLTEQKTLVGLIEYEAVATRLAGPIGSPVKVRFLDGRDRKVDLEIKRIRPRGTPAVVGNMPALYFWTESRTLQPGIGYVRFNLFFEPETLVGAIQKTLQACADCRGIIIDVRGNPGGLGGLATGVASFFTDKKGQQLGSMFLRGATVNFAVFPRPNPFLGPLAILTDECSASTSEVFAGGMQDLGRAHIIGTPTAGAALPSIFTHLPNGDGFQYAIANYVSEGGRTLEGNGVIPDEIVKLTRHQLLEGQDPVIDAAVTWIEKQPNAATKR